MTELVPAFDEAGELAWYDEESEEWYEMTPEEEQQLRAELQQQQQAEPEPEWSEDELNDAIDQRLQELEKHHGNRTFTAKEVERYANHVREHGEEPADEDWLRFGADLSGSNERENYMVERALETAPSEPYSSKDEPTPATTSEGSE